MKEHNEVLTSGCQASCLHPEISKLQWGRVESFGCKKFAEGDRLPPLPGPESDPAWVPMQGKTIVLSKKSKFL